jgi:hypothetical protein
MREHVRNIGASVRARLQNISRERHQTFQQVLIYYVLERLLYRLSQTTHRDRFALKGAMLTTKWFADPLRPTQDLDLLGFGDADPDKIKDDKLARAIAATFDRRKTEVPSEPPDALTLAFAEDPAKVQQWNSFVEDVAFQPGSLAEVIRDLTAFLMPYAAEARNLAGRRGTNSA